MDANLLTLVVLSAGAGVYLLVMPALILIYINKRFNTSGAWEKLLMFFLTLVFFPGMLVVGGFINHRPQLRQI